MKRRFFNLALAAIISVPFVPAPASAQEERVLRARSYADIGTTDPAFSTGVNDEEVGALVHRKLIQYKPGEEWDYQLDAAKSIEQVSPTRIAFELKPGIEFTNGYGELTAEDVKYSFERIIDPETGSPNQGDFGPLTEVEVTGKYTGELVFSEPFAPVWNIALPYIAGTIVSKEATEEAGGRFGVEAPAYSGPYIIENWSPKQRTTLVPNPQWTGEEQAFDRIEIYPIDDAKTAEIAFQAGDIDFTQASLSSVETLRGNLPDDVSLEVFPSLYYSFLGMNTEHPKLEDPLVREAIQRAVGVPSILDAAFFGVAEPSTGLIAPGLVGHREETVIPPEADLEAARALLDEAGVDELDLTLTVLNSSQWVTAAQVVQAMLQPIGINITIEQLESGTFCSAGDESKSDSWQDLQLILNRFSMTPDPYYATVFFNCEQVGVWNWERFCNPEFDRLHEQAASEPDPEVRDRLYKEMQDLMEQSGAYKFLTHGATPNLWRDNIEPALRPDGLPLFRYFE